MEPLVKHEGKVVVLSRVNVDTDQIIPKQFLKRIERDGFGEFLFYDWRYQRSGEPNPDFELNAERAQGASVLLADANFGCGSSREHAVWALRDYGIGIVIAPSFADIFFNNCFKNGVLPVVIPQDVRDELAASHARGEWDRATVDLAGQVIVTDHGVTVPFEVDPHKKHMLLNGLDDIGLTLQLQDDIVAYEDKRQIYQLTY
ncbi:3-isopropylmalate dehydratase small subunit [Alicyclobacillus fastidiosus]|uniref:3-isopropylmalate dehydratase small subunit n=1 Tax=Alicyclobacillus fastidiosus TaxID=392011 RepID=A0ABY6ZK31_9BACL|nr:3-isopropylmalate dehydratase small subunit [Alicyclobacillus fastidiosus]WAH43288.1 3-isopropylmalate dehydratase small subunit [Alicyclobacillus fastidiosus]GMA65340.1 3-isopropylmalate dehydratase small subunit [Alicyclobacillus fastidiosus]